MFKLLYILLLKQITNFKIVLQVRRQICCEKDKFLCFKSIKMITLVTKYLTTTTTFYVKTVNFV